jgi:ribosomal-protein-alanine N-acetyltransferase
VIFDELHINNLAVDPAWRRRGVAGALLTFVLASAAAEGATRATLEVRRSNEPARRLYERFGFAFAGVRTAYYREPVEDALVLWRGAPPGSGQTGIPDSPPGG